MAYSLGWLAPILRQAGLTVIEEPNWLKAGHGDVTTTKGVICHHTAGPRAGNTPSLNVVVNGRPGLKGPLAQLFLARNGDFHCVAAGLAWHAGVGLWQGIRTGNSSFVGIEAENTGLSNDLPWPQVQYDAYVQGVAAILGKIKQPAIMCCGHKEYATPRGRKTDPTFNMNEFRTYVTNLLGHKTVTNAVYVVKAGDTLYGIAKAYKMKLDELLDINHLTLATVIHPGDKLEVVSRA